ncbi:Sterile alpha motif/pointed domain [Pseudocohnilembus persalinus]|uniref:Sterile alpha motif/pointed domain n=1 Tax=Pseudocohnilembus persalinus TaxID=266149 RepID=A0A0V0R480_PSEPJ|nr:Sterile alpha motif/pointed domain [Pseudocohnilembus persalinus]|eukprot:KRX09029.1 Sterile alpha motif/pointed domain [Pseudocohnilembus persalinus]
MDNGDWYIGEYKDYMLHGYGKYYYKINENSYEIYIGEWKFGKRDGKGIYKYQGNHEYIGQWKQDLKQGTGIIKYSNGDQFKGNFYQNQKNGPSIYIQISTHKFFKQIWSRGELIKEIIGSEVKLIPYIKKFSNDNNQVKQPSPIEEIKANFEISSSDDSKQNKTSENNKQEIGDASLIRLNFMSSDSNNEDSNYNQYSNNYQLQPSYKLDIVQINENLELYAQVSENIRKIPIQVWSQENVRQLLIDIKLPQYQEQLKINGVILSQITENELKQTYDIKVIGHRKLILKVVKILIQGNFMLGLSSGVCSQSLESLSFNLALKKRTTNNLNEGIITEQEIEEFMKSQLSLKGVGINFLIDVESIDIQEKFAQGGYGEIFKGVYQGQQVAIKSFGNKRNLESEGSFNKGKAKSFLKEAEILNKIGQHPNIVLFMGVSIDLQNQYLLTEYLECGSLYQLIHKSQYEISYEKLLFIFYNIAQGMKYLHSKNICHCDLKSQNILLDKNLNPKICDFGLSRVKLSDEEEVKNYKKKGKQLGTYQWMAPEIIRGQSYQKYSDVYSFGMVLYEALIKQIPFKGMLQQQIIAKVGYDKTYKVQLPIEVQDLYDQELIDLVNQCIDKNYLKRPTFEEVVQGLQKILTKQKIMKEEEKLRQEKENKIKNENIQRNKQKIQTSVLRNLYDFFQ